MLTTACSSSSMGQKGTKVCTTMPSVIADTISGYKMINIDDCMLSKFLHFDTYTALNVSQHTATLILTHNNNHFQHNLLLGPGLSSLVGFLRAHI